MPDEITILTSSGTSLPLAPLRRINSRSFQADKAQERPGGNVFASAAETEAQTESRLNRFDRVHHPGECRVRIDSICNLLLSF